MAGFPRLGELAWFAVVLLDDNPGSSGGNRLDDDTQPRPTPDFDTLGEPAVELARRDDQDGRTRPYGA